MPNKISKILSLNFFIIVLVVVFAGNIAMIELSKKDLAQKVKAAEEIKRPADIEIIAVKNSACAECFDLNPFIDAIKSTNVKVAKEETFEASGEAGKKIIQEMSIKKLPAFIIKGEINKNDDVRNLLLKVGEIKNDNFSFSVPAAPYFDLASNSVKGKVVLTLITDSDCKECYDVNGFKQVLANSAGVLKPEVITIDKKEKSAQDILQKYKMKSLPAFILTGEVSEYPAIKGIWLQVGTLEMDGAYVLREIPKVNPGLVYRDLETGNIIKPETSK